MQKTAKYAVLGNPIAHSLSPFIHQQFAKQAKIKLDYKKILVTNDFAHSATSFIKAGGKGFNITIPYKTAALKFAHQISDNAKIAQAVNTIKITNNTYIGDNTDGAGLIADCQRLNININKQNILIIGAGGAVNGILAPLLNQQPQLITIANRTIAKAQALKQNLEKFGNINTCKIDKINQQSPNIIINATPNPPAISTKLIQNSICYDLNYAQRATFAHYAKKLGARQAFDGTGMLVEQAALSFKFFHNTNKIDTAAIISQLQNN